jgi:hypothetical protein
MLMPQHTRVLGCATSLCDRTPHAFNLDQLASVLHDRPDHAAPAPSVDPGKRALHLIRRHFERNPNARRTRLQVFLDVAAIAKRPNKKGNPFELGAQLSDLGE